VWPVGGTKPVRADISASSRAPTGTSVEEVEAGRFRGDLFYRLNVVHIALPPLRSPARTSNARGSFHT